MKIEIVKNNVVLTNLSNENFEIHPLWLRERAKTDDLVDPTFIHRSTKTNEALDAAPSFDATKYEEFDDEYPPGAGALENDPKMQATYDAILEDK